MPAPTPLRAYQYEAVSWIVRQLKGQHRAVLLADEAGLGKTLEALEAARQLKAGRILIVCPAGARRVWFNEIVRWYPEWTAQVLLVEPGASAADLRRCQLDIALIMIVGYDTFSAGEFKRIKAEWDLAIFDECHYLKNPSKRTLAIYGQRGTDEGVQAWADKVVLLSGTPCPNHAGELYQHIRTFWPEALPGNGSLAQFEDHYTRYRDTVFGRQVNGSKNQDRLRSALRDVVLRRRKSEVLDELPPLIVQDMPLDPTPVNTVAASLLMGVIEGKSDDEIVKILSTPDAATSSARQMLGLTKVPPTIEWVHERLFSADKILLFAWHRSVIEALSQALAEYKPAVIVGETGPAARAAAVERFQVDPHTRVFVGQILAAGTAITLTAASEVAIVEPSWVPGENTQAICRAHRLGQKDVVLASFLYLPGTLDQRIMSVFRRKAAEIGLLQGDT